ncbi:MAG: riboflavin synthase [Planctomycetota bacterium]
MFTGLVQSLAAISAITPEGPGVRISITEPAIAAEAALGDSIAINGCCLTVVASDEASMVFEAGPETLQRTTLGQLSTGDQVNLETSLSLGDTLGGHLVSGHVDGVGSVEQRQDDDEWSTFWIRVPGDLARQMASKGSVAVDGVSLTLVEVEDDRFSVALIPHTLAVTTLGGRQSGDQVNLETDLLAKYVQRQLEWKQ